MRSSVVTLIVATAISLASTAGAQETAHPFGLTFGTSLADMKKLIPDLVSTDTKFVYNSTSVPTPYPNFESYAFFINPTHGLCKVVAIGATIREDPYGTQTRARFRELQDALTKKYGEPFVVDSLIAKTVWDGPEDWAMSLSQKARVVGAAWPKGDGPLGFGLSAIELEARGLVGSSTYLVLSYFGANSDACRDQFDDAL